MNNLLFAILIMAGVVAFMFIVGITLFCLMEEATRRAYGFTKEEWREMQEERLSEPQYIHELKEL